MSMIVVLQVIYGSRRLCVAPTEQRVYSVVVSTPTISHRTVDGWVTTMANEELGKFSSLYSASRYCLQRRCGMSNDQTLYVRHNDKTVAWFRPYTQGTV